MAEIYRPRSYQEFMYWFTLKHPRCGLLADMGLGKSVVSLTVMKFLLDSFQVCKPLIVSTKRVVETVWVEEAQKWEHTKNLKGVKILGSAKERIQAINTDADFYCINRENISWLVDYYKSRWPYDMLIVDESSSFKSHKAQRFKALKLIRTKLDRIMLLTGTPAPNGYMDLWSQIYLLDGGERLGQHITDYRRVYFDAAQHQGHIVLKYAVKKDAIPIIQNKISDICISIKSSDYLKDLPKAIDNVIKIQMPPHIKDQYEDFERQQVLLLKGKKITAINRAVLVNKLLQFASGQVYDEVRQSYILHDLKINVFEELLDEANGQPMLVGYSYKHAAERLINKFKARELKTKTDVDEWNKGNIPLMIAHPASAGHGLNLQFGGHILTWYEQNWSLELTQQFDKRIDRPGQKFTVIKNKLILQGTMDEDVMRSLNYKDKNQDILLEAVKARIEKYL